MESDTDGSKIKFLEERSDSSRYLYPAACAAAQNLVRYHFSKDRKRSEDFFAEYENFLGVEIADFVSASDAQVIELFQEHLDPLQQTALNMGFPLWQ